MGAIKTSGQALRLIARNFLGSLLRAAVARAKGGEANLDSSRPAPPPDSGIPREQIDLANYLLKWARRQLPEEEAFQIPEVTPRTTPPHNTWSYQNRVLNHAIREGDRVLDIGSGGWPFTQATHLADRYLEKTTHRVEGFKQDGRPVINLDVQRLPFREKSWDYILCSHVLEHVERPGDACRELMRVAKRGYIELPTRLSDVMFNFTGIEQHHRWHGLVQGRTLVFIEWREEERIDMGSNHFFLSAHSTLHNPFQQMLEDHWGTFFAMLPWEGHFHFLVIDHTGAVIDHSGATPETPHTDNRGSSE